MKMKIFSATLSLLAGALIVSGCSALAFAAQQKAPATAGTKITVLNPAATNLMVARVPLSPRLSSLDGKTIYMVDIGWGGPEAGYDVLQVISKRLAQIAPTAKTVILRKKGSYAADDPDLWKQIKASGQAAILGLSC